MFLICTIVQDSVLTSVSDSLDGGFQRIDTVTLSLGVGSDDTKRHTRHEYDDWSLC